MAKRKQPYRYGVPAKYLEGLSDAAAKKRAAEIKRTAKAYKLGKKVNICLLYTSPSPRDQRGSRMPSSA